MENLIQKIFAISLGMMIFFSFVLAPMIFKILDAENAGKFVRKIFPYYYFVNLVFLSSVILLFFYISKINLDLYVAKNSSKSNFKSHIEISKELSFDFN